MIRLTKEANNLHRLELDDITIWFSYETPIAFRCTIKETAFNMFVITKNIWSPTTGKHLNIINPDKKIRVDNSNFNEALTRVVNRQ